MRGCDGFLFFRLGVFGLLELAVPGLLPCLLAVPGLLQSGVRGRPRLGAVVKAGPGLADNDVCGLFKPGMPGMLKPGVTGLLRPGVTGLLKPGVTGLLKSGVRGLLKLGEDGLLKLGVLGLLALVPPSWAGWIGGHAGAV